MTTDARFGVLTRRELAVGFAALTVLALFAWWFTVSQARGMGSMPGTMGMPILAFLAMWIVMMIAMMLPATTPVVALWGRMIVLQSPGVRRIARMAVFLGAYLLAWGLIGVLVWLGLRSLESIAPQDAFTNGLVAAAAFALAGIYQLTPAKNLCLEHCRSPVSLLAHFRGRGGPVADLRIGFLHGGYCIGCCAGLMVVLMGVGLMNLPAMVVLTGLIFAEKLAPGGAWIARISGFLFLAIAPIALMRPQALASAG